MSPKEALGQGLQGHHQRGEDKALKELKNQVAEVGRLASELKSCLELLHRVEEAMGGDLQLKVGPPPSSARTLGEPCVTLIGPDDKEVKLTLGELQRRLAEGSIEALPRNIEELVEDLATCVKRAEHECVSYLESAVDAILADEEAVLEPFKHSKPFSELLAKVAETRASLPSERGVSSLKRALDLALSVKSSLDQLRPKAVNVVKETAARLLAEAHGVLRRAAEAGIEASRLEERVEEAEKLRSLSLDINWEALSFYMREVGEGLRQLEELKEGLSRVGELERIREDVDYIASKLPELRRGLEEARAKVEGLIQSVRRGGVVSQEEVEDVREEVEEALVKSGAGRVAKALREVYEELQGELGRRGVPCVVEEPPSSLGKRGVLDEVKKLAQCKDEIEGLLKTMSGSKRMRALPVAELKKGLLEEAKTKRRGAA